MKTFNNKKSGVKTSDIDSSGVLDIDASGLVSMDSVAGSITIGAALADAQTLKLGKNGATEMIFTPHATPGSEKISLTNTEGDAANAISLTSTAGGITIDAGNGTVTFADNGVSLGTITSNGCSKVTVTDSGTNTNFPVVFHDENNALLDDTGSFTYNPSNGDLIVKGGNLKVQNTGGATNLQVSTNGNIITDNIIGTGADSGHEYISFKTGNEVNTFINHTERLSVTTSGVNITGSITSTGDITGLTSDKRLKTNIEIIESPLEKINQLSGFTYNWSKEKCEKAGFDPIDEKQVGVFAQDIQAVLPEAVKPAPFDTDSEGNSISGDNYLTVQYEKIVPLLIECIKELKEEIDELKNKV